MDENEIHIWAACLRAPAELPPSLESLLNPDEQARADRFHFERDRQRFVAGRAMLRILLGRYLRRAPEDVRFAYGTQGKPVVAGLQFNLAHSEDLALLAVTPRARVGVDVERIRVLPDAGELVARFFSPREQAAYERLSEEEKPQAFYNLWTRKEAWLKATGEGIGHLLNQVEVCFAAGEPARFLSLPHAETLPGTHWFLRELCPAPGFAAALAYESRRNAEMQVRLNSWRWPNTAEGPENLICFWK